MHMDTLNFPIKRNLFLTKQRLALARKGYDLLDKKLHVLMNELRVIQIQANGVWEELKEVLDNAHKRLHDAHMEMGIKRISQIAECSNSPVSDDFTDGYGEMCFRSIMGVELPQVNREEAFSPIKYTLHNTTASLDEATLAWKEARKLIISWAVIENTMYRLRLHIRKTQKRANALGNITIPKYEARVKYIGERLEERERDELARMKLAKKQRT